MRRTWAIGALVVLALAIASIALASGLHHGHGRFGARLSGFNNSERILVRDSAVRTRNACSACLVMVGSIRVFSSSRVKMPAMSRLDTSFFSFS